MAELAQHVAREPAPAQGVAQIAEAGSIADRVGDLGTVEVGAEADTIDTGLLDQMVEMADEYVEPGIGVDLSVGPQETSGEIDADHAS